MNVGPDGAFGRRRPGECGLHGATTTTYPHCGAAPSGDSEPDFVAAVVRLAVLPDRERGRGVPRRQKASANNRIELAGAVELEHPARFSASRC